MLLAQMTLANKINMVTGGGTSEPYVFYIPAIPSLCGPAMGQQDGPVGVGDGRTGVTELPSAASLAATWDPSLATQYGQVIGAEEHGKGAMVNLGPTANIDRDPRWGREFEAFTEDPYLNASMATRSSASGRGTRSTCPRSGRPPSWPAAPSVTVHYTDGTSSSTSLNLADWYSNAPAVGDQC